MADDYNTGIEDELKANKANLESIRTMVEEQNKKQQDISKYVAELEKFRVEIKQAGGSYEKIVQGKVEIAKIANNKKLEEEEKGFSDQIRKVEDRLNEVAGFPGNKFKELQAKQNSLEKELENAKTEVEQAQKQYENLKGQQRKDEATLKILQDLKAIFDREQQQENKFSAFYTLGKIRENLQPLTLKETVQFTQELENGGKALAAASRKFRLKSGDLERVMVELEAAQKGDIKYRADVFAELQKSKPQPQLKSAQQAKQATQSRQQAQSAVSVDS